MGWADEMRREVMRSAPHAQLWLGGGDRVCQTGDGGSGKENAQALLSFLLCVMEPHAESQGREGGRVWRWRDGSVLHVWFLGGYSGRGGQPCLDQMSMTQGTPELEMRIWGVLWVPGLAHREQNGFHPYLPPWPGTIVQ